MRILCIKVVFETFYFNACVCCVGSLLLDVDFLDLIEGKNCRRFEMFNFLGLDLVLSEFLEIVTNKAFIRTYWRILSFSA